MEGSDEGEVSLKEVKHAVLLLAKQMVELKAALSQREEAYGDGQTCYAVYKKLEQCKQQHKE